MTKDEALKLALEALKDPHPGVRTAFSDALEYRERVKIAITAIKEVLVTKDVSLPEQEPVAFYNPQHGGFYWAKPTTIHAPQAVDIVPLALYTSPPQREWVGLTDEEKHEIRYSHMTSAEFIEFIEAKLKEKNT